MVVAELKPLEEILETIRAAKNILVAGCAGCTAVCLAGGQKEVDMLCRRLASAAVKADGVTVERQCEKDFLSLLDPLAGKYDAILSMACGAGVQMTANRFRNMRIYPALNTVFIGTAKDVGWYEEYCRSCGDCQLAYTGGICPVTRCSKSLFNGPCGGTNNGKCEAGSSIPCAWQQIYERLNEQGRADDMLNIRRPANWRNQKPGTVIQEPYRNRYK